MEQLPEDLKNRILEVALMNPILCTDIVLLAHRMLSLYVVDYKQWAIPPVSEADKVRIEIMDDSLHELKELTMRIRKKF